MSGFSISIDLGELMDIGGVLDKQILPRVHEAVGGIAHQAKVSWADAVMKAPGVWAEEKTRYAQSISWSYTGDFSATVTTTYDKAEQIESGRPSRDLKRMLNTSMKVRLSAKGKRYLIIPMRHNVPGAEATGTPMPPSVHEAAKMLSRSSVTGMGSRVSGTGAWDVGTRSPVKVPQAKYKWGARLDTTGMAGLSAQEQSRYHGMVKMQSRGAGKAAHSSYMTFRVMHEGSSGWIVPAKPGLYLARDVATALQPVAEAVIAKAVKLDIGG